MNQLEEQITIIQGKLQLLLKKYNALLRENDALKREVRQRREQQEELSGKIEFWESQALILKASAGSLAPPEKAAFEKKINQYLKDIDRCIALLNN